MCGIIGFISMTNGEGLRKRRFLDQALVIDTIRGHDSAGVFAAAKDQNMSFRDGLPAYAKVVGTGPDLIRHHYYKDIFNGGIERFKYVVGHNRAATRGGISAATAHPYQEGPITLVHNGTLIASGNLKVSQFEGKYLNDSHTICHNLAMATDPLDVLQKLDGAYALVWHDTRDDSLNIARNKERPLHMAKSRDSDTIYFASEGEMLYFLDGRIDLNLGTIVSLKVGNYLKFTKDDLMKPKITPFKVFEYVTPWKYPQTTIMGSPAASTNLLYSKSHGNVSTYKPRVLNPRVDIGTKMILVPDALEAELIDFELTSDELERFVGCKADKVTLHGKTTYTVWGYLEDKTSKDRTYDAEIHGVPCDIWERHADRVWSIRPLGIKWLSKDLPCVVGRWNAIVCPDGTITYIASRLPRPQSTAKKETKRAPFVYDDDDEDDGEDPYSALTMFPGPHGSYLTADGWRQAVVNGCVHCGGGIPIQDAEFVEWVNDGQDPLCTKCVDFFSQGSEEFPYDGYFDDADEGPAEFEETEEEQIKQVLKH